MFYCIFINKGKCPMSQKMPIFSKKGIKNARLATLHPAELFFLSLCPFCLPSFQPSLLLPLPPLRRPDVFFCPRQPKRPREIPFAFCREAQRGEQENFYFSLFGFNEKRIKKLKKRSIILRQANKYYTLKGYIL